eukprot:CAMPEP_0201592074 /NCGR_PEP_ID=MMETSP0190_2-20130828/190066_1 /ASSEMBLY_ACC=CAM_ASM_000263 /TAXON_ID=37353 /ORGANISM="Rosalina sp." /LENGTH=563 /DNA_ID=CAMNT_0048050675 /DNA_START=30 /DNA_END=1721 /DNA_ORIENTATION=+
MTPSQLLFLTLGLYSINGVLSRSCNCPSFCEADCDADSNCKWVPQNGKVGICRTIAWAFCEMDEECRDNRNPVTGKDDPYWPYDCPDFDPTSDCAPTRQPIEQQEEATEEEEDNTNTNHKGNNKHKNKNKNNDEDDLDDEDFLPNEPGTTEDKDLPDCADYGKLTNQECGCAESGICKGLDCIDGPNVVCQNGGICCCAPRDPHDKIGYCEGVNQAPAAGGAAGGGGQQPPPPQGGAGAGAGGQTGKPPPPDATKGPGSKPPPPGDNGAGGGPADQPPPPPDATKGPGGGQPPPPGDNGSGGQYAAGGGGGAAPAQPKKKKKKKKAAPGTTAAPPAILKQHDFYYGSDDNSQYGEDQSQYEDNGYDQQQMPPQQPGYGDQYGDNSGYYPPQQPIPPQQPGYGDQYGYDDQQQLTDDDDGDDGSDGAQGLPPPQQGAPPQQGQPPPAGAQPPPQQGAPPPPDGQQPPPDGVEPPPPSDGSDSSDTQIGLGADINIIQQAPNVGTTIKFGYAEIFIAFICVVLLCCGMALCWNKKKYGSMKKLVDYDDDNGNTLHFNYSTFDNSV